MSKQKFAWLPKKVWNMKTGDYHDGFIWLCWYWDDGEEIFNCPIYRLTDEAETIPIQWHRYTRTNTNRW